MIEYSGYIDQDEGWDNERALEADFESCGGVAVCYICGKNFPAKDDHVTLEYGEDGKPWLRGCCWPCNYPEDE